MAERLDTSSAVNDLPTMSVRRPYLAVVLNLLIMIAGFGALLGVEVRELPDVDRPIVTVRGDYPGASPETMDAEVTSIVEAAVARVNGVKEVRASSEENNFRLRAVFNPNVNLIDAANDVREAVSRVERQLPDRVENLTVIKADADATSIVTLAVYSESLQIDDLTRVVEDQVIPELTSVEGVADVNVFGDQERVLRVLLDPMRLASYGLSVADVAKVMRNARYDVPAGSFQSREQEVLVRANASVIDPKKIEDLFIREPVRIGDVASVFFGPAEAESWVRLNGRTVLSLGIVRQASSNTIAIAEGVAGVVKRLKAQIPAITIETISDDSLFIKGSIGELLVTLGYTIMIVVFVLFVFTGQFRASLIPTVAIPVALVGSLAAVWLLGFSINLITLLAMVLAAGVVVDDAIVVLENIQRMRAQGIKTRAAAVLGTRQVFFAVLATTATLVSVFVPISFLPSTAGRLFQEFGFVLAVTVMISSFVALSLVPMLSSKLPNRAPGGPAKGVAAILHGLGRAGLKAYTVPLDMVLKAPILVFILCAAVIATAYVAYQDLGEELVPEEDRGKITVRLTGPDGVGLPYTDRQVEQVEKILAPYVASGVVEKLFTITGRYDLNRGQIDAPLIPWEERTISEGDIAKDVNRKLAKIPGAQARVRRGNSLNLRNADGGLEIALIGADYDHIFVETNKFVRQIENNLPWISNMRVEFRATQPELSIDIDRRRATDLGVDIEDLATTIQVLVDEFEVAELTVNDKAVPIMLQASEAAVNEPSDIANLYVTAAGGRLVPLSQLISFSESSVPAELDRHAQRRAIEIDADIAPGRTLREAIEAVQALAAETLIGDVGLIFLGEAKTLNETSHDLLVTYLIAFVVVFLVLVAQFESITSAVVVMLTVPFGICAAIFALYITGTSINIYSQIGVLMLTGIMAKNAILMVEFADQLREQGLSPRDAAREASLVRFRPIMMTMVSTVFGGLPLILGVGPGAEARVAIGWVIFGGLGMAAAITLLLTPVLYALIAGLSKPRSQSGEELTGELRAVDKSHAPAE
ncbi:efflux RND transporter permease subunit [Thalassospiraceae bacterium LMO-JJ14]|nr:efflux RND transporter permease subunit [Thalassospiraceae bacterium LMO-JJ14]